MSAEPRIPCAEPCGTGPFYEEALHRAAGRRYRHALRARGLEGEIALLRVRLYALLAAEGQQDAESPDAQVTGQVLRIVDLLIKASRLSGTRESEDQAALERALEEEALRLLAPEE